MADCLRAEGVDRHRRGKDQRPGAEGGELSGAARPEAVVGKVNLTPFLTPFLPRESEPDPVLVGHLVQLRQTSCAGRIRSGQSHAWKSIELLSYFQKRHCRIPSRGVVIPA